MQDELCVEVSSEAYGWLSGHGYISDDSQPSRTVTKAKPQTSAAVERARRQLQGAIHRFLTKAARRIADAVRRSSSAKLAKAKDDDADALLRRLPEIDWKELVPDLETNLAAAAREGGKAALVQLQVSHQDLIADVNEIAGDWASQRAAELVGLRRLAGGRLIPNPHAQWTITEHTRDELRRIVKEAFDKETRMSELADQIESAGAFSETRAGLIAHTEVVRAENQGNLAGWRQSGLVEALEWRLSDDHPDGSDCNCEENAAGGPYSILEVPELPDHPGCICSLGLARLVDQDEKA